MNTPILTASGTFGFGEEFEDFVDLKKLGGVCVKCITLKPRAGNSGVRITETPAGMLNAIGLENPGVEKFLSEILPRIKDKMNVIEIVWTNCSHCKTQVSENNPEIFKENPTITRQIPTV